MRRYGTYELFVITFGFKNAQSHFQCSMNLILSNLLDKCVLLYIDNILI